MTITRKETGFTLVEVLVYIFILVILSVLIANVLMVMLRSYTYLRLSRSLQESSVVSMDRITREIKQATSVDVVNSILSSDPGKLVLNTQDDEGVPTTIEFSLVDSTLMVKEGAAVAVPATAPDVTVNDLIFTRLINEKSEAVRVELRATATRGSNSREAKFYATTVLRGSY